MTDRARRAAPFIAFATACYLPLLLTAPGWVVADTKSYLYLDPGRLLSRAWSMWDPQVGMGTVTHQNIGFLWPMGPYYWLFEQAGVPDWTAQRIWLGSILLAAGLGTWFLARTIGWRGPGVAAAVAAYAFTPYLLTIAPRISAILLPYAALPWMIALLARATRAASWRHPALFALVVATAGTSNATAIVLAGIGPALWVLWAAVTRQHDLPRLVAAVSRTGLLTLATNAWWIVGLSVQATHGVDVLRYTESVATTAAASTAPEVLRGLGYWFFYGDDALGPWIGPSRPYQTSLLLLVVTFAVPVLALGAGALGRWRERSFAVALLVLGTALAVGVYPYDSPSPFGGVLRSFLHSDVGMAMRSMPRAVPLVVLALSLLLGSGVRAIASRSPRGAYPAAGLVIVLVLLALPPLWQRTFVPENLRRPEAIPDYWQEVAEHLDATDDGTRVLEVPGTDFTSYRWGTTIDPVTPGLTDRPIVARELVPMGSAGAANLLKAFDGRLQANLAEATTVAPLARLMRAGQILVRSDLAYEHYDTPRPRGLWHFLLGSPGLGPATAFGEPVPNTAGASAPMLDELELSSDPSHIRDPFPVTVLPVWGARPITAAKPTASPVVLAGDGDGLVDSAAARLLDGTELIRYSASMSDRELDQALDDGAVLVLTDTNRRRAERWGSIRFTSGYTEPSGLVPLRVDRTDARLPVFPQASDAGRTIAVHRGGITANATSYGGRNEYLPEDRPANAVDGDPATAWRTSLNDPVRGERLELTVRREVSIDTVTFTAPPAPINRWVTRVALRFDDGPAVVRDLDARSRQAPGQTVGVGAQTFRRLTVEILDDSVGTRPRYGGLTSTGFAEVRIGDLRLDEAIRPPTDLLDRAGASSLDHALALVLTRLRAAATDIERGDEEVALVRLVDLPTAREFALTGTARLSPRASDQILDDVLGRPSGWVVTSSSRMGTVASRASSATDGDGESAWTSAYGAQVGQWIDLAAPSALTIDHLDLEIVADGRHSVPTRIGIDADGQRVASVTLPRIVDRAAPGATVPVRLSLPEAVTATSWRVVVDEARELRTTDWSTRAVRVLPIAVAEVRVPGVEWTAPDPRFSTGCRSDLLTLDLTTVPVVVAGPLDDALSGKPLRVRTCDEAGVPFHAGDTELRATPGSRSGIDLDRVVWRSAPGGAADRRSTPLRAGVDAGGAPSVTVTRSAPDAITVRVERAVPDEPFWLTLGQSWSDGWVATSRGLELGPPVLVDGFANGWRITPTESAFEVALRFAPQRRVDVALWASLVAALACLVLAVRRPREAAPLGPAPSAPVPRTDGEVQPLSAPAAGATALALGTLALVLATPAVAVLVGALALVRARAVVPRWLTAGVAPLAMALSGAYVVLTVARHRVAPGLEWPAELDRAHPLAWLAVLALAVDVIVVAVQTRRRR